MSTNQLLRLGLNYLGHRILEQYGLQTQQREPDTAPPDPEISEVPGLRRLAKMDGGIITIVGAPYTGKTKAAQRLAELMGRPTWAVSPHEKPPKWIYPLAFEDILELPPPRSTLIMDDALTYFSSKDYNKKLVREAEKIFPTARHERKLIIIVCVQVTSLLDKYGLRTDALVCKRPDRTVADIERPGMRRTFNRIGYVWEGQSDSWVQRHAYLIVPDWEGVVRVDKPQGHITAAQ